jgi:hypothetical protein
MQTPDGRECKFYYRQANPRYREMEECRIPKTENSIHWKPAYCTFCPVPDILRANASLHLRLNLTIRPPFLGMFGSPKMRIQSYCAKHDLPLDDPYVGCPSCNQERTRGLDLFAKALENTDFPDDSPDGT